MPQELSHLGTIVGLLPGAVKVHVGDGGDKCGGCSVKFMCKPNGDSGSIIEIPVKNSTEYTEGQHVRITLSDNKQYSATLIAMVLPCIALCLGVAIAYFAGLDEGLCALSGLFSTGLYFGILYLLRKSVNRRFLWNIEKLTN